MQLARFLNGKALVNSNFSNLLRESYDMDSTRTMLIKKTKSTISSTSECFKSFPMQKKYKKWNDFQFYISNILIQWFSSNIVSQKEIIILSN